MGVSFGVCHVCGSRDHTAGFDGAAYRDCLTRPCYLCKTPGHTTSLCPHNAVFGRGPPAARAPSRARAIRARETYSCTRTPVSRAPPREWALDAGVFSLHSRRVTSLCFVGAGDTLVSGDRGGELAAWRFSATRHEGENTRVAWTGAKWAITGLSGLGTGSTNGVWASSADGTVKLWDIAVRRETAVPVVLNGSREWIAGAEHARGWHVALAVAAVRESATVALVGDDSGRVWLADSRIPASAAQSIMAASSGSRVASLDVHPHTPDLWAAASNDHTARLFDLRRAEWTRALSDGGTRDGTRSAARLSPLATLSHERGVTGVRFSPNTGTRLATTCSDNRVYVWDVGSLVGGALGPVALDVCSPEARDIDSDDSKNALPVMAPLRVETQSAIATLVHSHDPARFLSPFRAEWLGADSNDRSVAIGRFISEPMTTLSGERLALHPIDILRIPPGASRSVGTSLHAALAHPLIKTITPVVATHPTKLLIAGGSSRGVFLWRADSGGKDEEDVRVRALFKRWWRDESGDASRGDDSRAVDAVLEQQQERPTQPASPSNNSKKSLPAEMVFRSPFFSGGAVGSLVAAGAGAGVGAGVGASAGASASAGAGAGAGTAAAAAAGAGGSSSSPSRYSGTKRAWGTEHDESAQSTPTRSVTRLPSADSTGVDISTGLNPDNDYRTSSAPTRRGAATSREDERDANAESTRPGIITADQFRGPTKSPFF